MNYWENKSVIVTGGTSGLGRNLVLKLVHMGAKVAFCGRSKEKLSEVLNEIGESNNIFYDTFEITEEERSISFIKDAAKKFGTIDVLINCAGANTSRGPITEMKIEDLEAMIKLNTIAPLVFIKECYKYMKENNEGLIVNILSTCCLFANEGVGAYTTAKGALDSLTKVLRKEARKDNIRVCAIYPGGINTTFRAQAREEYLSPESTADAILKALDIDKNVAMDEIILRPYVETNYS